MKARRVDSVQTYLLPNSPQWSRVPTTPIAMIPAPLGMQPTEYMRASWQNKPYGETAQIDVSSVHDGGMWALRAAWSGSGSRATDFPDALAIALPVRNAPLLVLMGAEDAPIHYLYWRANRDGVESRIATGIGKSAAGPDIRREARAAADGALWQVVITRAMGSGENVAPLAAGQKTGVGFALWRGSNDERSGIKAFSIDWAELELER